MVRYRIRVSVKTEYRIDTYRSFSITCLAVSTTFLFESEIILRNGGNARLSPKSPSENRLVSASSLNNNSVNRLIRLSRASGANSAPDLANLVN
jgi:hypothetical protein